MWAAKEEIQAAAGTAAGQVTAVATQQVGAEAGDLTFELAVKPCPTEFLLQEVAVDLVPYIQEISLPQPQGLVVEVQGWQLELLIMELHPRPAVAAEPKTQEVRLELGTNPELRVPLDKEGPALQVAILQAGGAEVAIMGVAEEGFNPQEQTLHPLAVAAPATRATLAMRPCKRAFAMGMGKSSLPIKKAD